MLPKVIEITKEGRIERDLLSFQFENERVIYLTGEVTDRLAEEILVQIHYLESKSKDDITVYINSPGGSVSAGLAICDAMLTSPCDIRTIVTGIAASMGAFISTCGGNKKKRFITRNGEMMIHQPLGGAQGQASDIELVANHIINTKRKLNQMLALATGRNVCDIARDTDRDYYLSATEALEYGLVDGII